MPGWSASAWAAAILFAAATIGTGAGAAQKCPGAEGFPAWLDGFRQEAAAQGISAGAISALDGVRYDQSVIAADRKQGVFSQSFLQFSDRMVADYRMTQGRKLLRKYKDTFARIEQEFGVPGPVITAFWGLETDFGANLGQDVALIRPNGVIASYSSTANPEPVFPYYPLAYKGVTLRLVQAYILPGPARALALADIAEALAEGVLRHRIAAVFSLEETAAAHELLESGEAVGTVVVTLT